MDAVDVGASYLILEATLPSFMTPLWQLNAELTKLREQTQDLCNEIQASRNRIKALEFRLSISKSAFLIRDAECVALHARLSSVCDWAGAGAETMEATEDLRNANALIASIIP